VTTPPPRIWYHPTELRYPEATSFLAGTPVALVAGFSLAAAISVADTKNANLIRQCSVVAFTVASALGLVALVVSYWMRLVMRTPNDVHEWTPELAVSDVKMVDLERARLERSVWQVALLLDAAEKLAAASFFAALAGLSLLIFSRPHYASFLAAGAFSALFGLVVALMLVAPRLRGRVLAVLDWRAMRRAPTTDTQKWSGRHRFDLERFDQSPLPGRYLAVLTPGARDITAAGPETTGVPWTHAEILSAAEAIGAADVYLEARAVLVDACDDIRTSAGSLIGAVVFDDGAHRSWALHPLAKVGPGQLLVSVNVPVVARMLGVDDRDVWRRIPVTGQREGDIAFMTVANGAAFAQLIQEVAAPA
jgi:hypothetical protein